MTKTQTLVKTAYGEHFQHLKEIAEHIDALNKLLSNAPADIKVEIENYVREAKAEIKKYADNLESRGAELYKKVA